MQILDEWLRDIPQQFQGKPKIKVLFGAFAKQLEELNKVYNDLAFKTDIDTADGIVLDDVGSIVTLNRKQAGLLTGIASNEPIISDERYRQMLKYKVLLNTNSCTYDDIMDGIQFFYDGKVRFVENPAYPANFFLKADKLDIEESDHFLNSEVIIKASGVSAVFEKSYMHKCVVSTTIDVGINFCIGFFFRANTELLLLDGNWFLDGSATLDGYKEEFINCYPSYGAILFGIINAVWSDGMNRFFMGAIHEEVVYNGYLSLLGIVNTKVIAESTHIKVGCCHAIHWESALIQKVFGEYLCQHETDAKKLILNMESKNQIIAKPVYMKIGNCIDVPERLDAITNVIRRSFINQNTDIKNCSICGSIRIVEDYTSSLLTTFNTNVKTDNKAYLTVEKDLWYFNGAALLDGSNGMSAHIFNYELI